MNSGDDYLVARGRRASPWCWGDLAEEVSAVEMRGAFGLPEFPARGSPVVPWVRVAVERALSDMCQAFDFIGGADGGGRTRTPFGARF